VRISHGVTQWGIMSRYPDIHSASVGSEQSKVVSYNHTQTPLYTLAKEVSLVICVSKQKSESRFSPSDISSGASSTPSDAEKACGWLDKA
jgi:hypothetical protein